MEAVEKKKILFEMSEGMVRRILAHHVAKEFNAEPDDVELEFRVQDGFMYGVEGKPGEFHRSPPSLNGALATILKWKAPRREPRGLSEEGTI